MDLKCKQGLDGVFDVENDESDEAILAKYLNDDDFEDDNPCLAEPEYYRGLKNGFKASWSDLWELTKSLGNSQTYKDLFYAFKVISCNFPCPDAEVMLDQIKMIDGIKSKLLENVGVLSCYEEGLATGKVFTDMLAGEGIAAGSKKAIRLIGKAANKVKIAKPIESAAKGLSEKKIEVKLPFWDKNIIFEGVKVFQRDNLINPKIVSSWKRKGVKITGTNKERMLEGLAPIGEDGLPLNLHHLIQSDKAGLVEINASFHQKHF